MSNAKETIMRKHFFQGFPITPKGDNNQLLRNHFQIMPLRQINQQYLLSSYTHSFDVTDWRFLRQAQCNKCYSLKLVTYRHYDDEFIKTIWILEINFQYAKGTRWTRLLLLLLTKKSKMIGCAAVMEIISSIWNTAPYMGRFYSIWILAPYCTLLLKRFTWKTWEAFTDENYLKR